MSNPARDYLILALSSAVKGEAATAGEYFSKALANKDALTKVIAELDDAATLDEGTGEDVEDTTEEIEPVAAGDEPGELEGEAQDGTNREEIEAADEDEDEEEEEEEEEEDDTTEASDDDEDIEDVDDDVEEDFDDEEEEDTELATTASVAARARTRRAEQTASANRAQRNMAVVAALQAVVPAKVEAAAKPAPKKVTKPAPKKVAKK